MKTLTWKKYFEFKKEIQEYANKLGLELREEHPEPDYFRLSIGISILIDIENS